MELERKVYTGYLKIIFWPKPGVDPSFNNSLLSERVAYTFISLSPEGEGQGQGEGEKVLIKKLPDYTVK
jgi:hypothetical protein